ncbi:MAG: ABC transporter permease, partial [Clostridia bacterium]|nr:ABC transporter permease [Clostridia bacterium]
ITSVMMTLMQTTQNSENEPLPEEGTIRSNTIMFELLDTLRSIDVHENNLVKFLEYVDSLGGDFNGAASAIALGYNNPLTLYSTTVKDKNGLPKQLNPSNMFSSLMGGGAMVGAGSTGGTGSTSGSMGGSMGGSMMGGGAMGSGSGMSSPMMNTLEVWQEMIDNRELLDKQYDVVWGDWPTQWNEVVLVVDANYEINDVFLYALGLKDSAELEEMFKALIEGKEFEVKSQTWTYDDIIGTEYALILPCDLYKKNGTEYTYMGGDSVYMNSLLENSEKIKITAIIKPDEDAVATSITGAIGYLPSLTTHILDYTAQSDIVKAQLLDPTRDVITGLRFPATDGSEIELSAAEKAEILRGVFAKMTDAERAAAYTKFMCTLSDEDAEDIVAGQLAMMSPDQIRESILATLEAQTGMSRDALEGYLGAMSDEEYSELVRDLFVKQAQAMYAAEMQAVLSSKTQGELSEMLMSTLETMPDEEITEKFVEYIPKTVSDMSYEEVLELLGYADKKYPTSVKIYADTFEAKDKIVSLIDAYNKKCTDEGREEDVINYTDYVGLMMSSVSTIIDIISYVLIAFVSISLVVSSIMIGIITYISVLERTKEIGILRAVGASKKDIARVFNAETLIIGFTAGALGIIITMGLSVIANIIIEHFTDVGNLARMPVDGAIVLILISVGLTMLSGLIPAGVAAKKDPVEALRSE